MDLPITPRRYVLLGPDGPWVLPSWRTHSHYLAAHDLRETCKALFEENKKLRKEIARLEEEMWRQ